MRDRMRPAFFERCRVRELSESDLLRDARLARTDPDLLSLRNLNNPAEYEEARARPAPPVTARRFGTPASARDRELLALRAATLATAAAASVPLDRHVVAALNGDQISRGDPELPLAAGDVLAFLSADAGG